MSRFDFKSLIFFSTLLLSFLSLILWFLVRTQSRKVWMPILRVIDLHNSQVQKYKKETPPLISFFLFTFCAIVMLVFSSKPELLIKQNTTKDSLRIHLFLDLNPSMEATLNLSNYVNQLEKVWASLGSTSKLSVSTTYSSEILNSPNFEQVKNKVLSLGYHRAGVDLGSAFKQQRNAIGDIDGLLIFSDGHSASWKKFNWNLLEEQMKIYLIRPVQNTTLVDNVYFHHVQLVSAPFDPTLEWDVELDRAGDMRKVKSGVVKVLYNADVLASFPWNFDQDVNRTQIRVRVHSKKISKLKVPEGDTQLLWVLETHDHDSMEIDNTFRMPFSVLRQDAWLIGEPFGERSIEDPFYQLNMVLQTFGFIPQRKDVWSSEHQKLMPPLLVFSIKESVPLQETCPLSLANKREEGRLEERNEKFPTLWLFPQVAMGSRDNLCRCFQKLMGQSESLQSRCSEALNPQTFNEVMKASGAKPLGAKISELENSLGWVKEDLDMGLKLTVFVIPLRPSRLFRLNHAMFPLMVKEILQFQNLIDEGFFIKNLNRDWPRITDLSRYPEWIEGSYGSSTLESNVPESASSMVYIQDKLLPQGWMMQERPLYHQEELFQKEEFEPGEWLVWMMRVLGFVMLLELLWNARLLWKRKNLTSTALLILVCFLPSPDIRAELALNVVGAHYTGDFKNPLKELSVRTSIEIEEDLTYFPPDMKSLSEPLYWVRDAKFLKDKDGKLKKEIRIWLKKGGFLVLMGLKAQEIQSLIKEAFVKDIPDAGWRVIPPDHELMRSFYLIDALPSCSGKVWDGFVFDGRLAILSIPFDFLQALSDPNNNLGTCEEKLAYEYKFRSFVNVIMAIMTTDYKRDQIHMKEILKRLK